MAEDVLPAPTERDLSRARAALTPLRLVHRPTLHGADCIPTEGGALLVGNHGLFGVIDSPLMGLEIARVTGRHIRPLGDHGHFKLPGWRDLLRQAGTVPGTRENATALLRDGQLVLVFPGGAREVFKRRDESYKLVWKQRTGFLRVAIDAGVPIIPFGAVGADETFEIVADIDHTLAAPLRLAARKAGFKLDYALPIVRGIGPTVLPRPQQFHFTFGPPINVSDLAHRTDDRDALMQRRDEVQADVEQLIQRTLAIRDKTSQPLLHQPSSR